MTSKSFEFKCQHHNKQKHIEEWNDDEERYPKRRENDRIQSRYNTLSQT